MMNILSIKLQQNYKLKWSLCFCLQCSKCKRKHNPQNAWFAFKHTFGKKDVYTFLIIQKIKEHF